MSIYKFSIKREAERFCRSLPPPFDKACIKLAEPIVKKYQYYSDFHQRNLFYVFRDFIHEVLLKRKPMDDDEVFLSIVNYREYSDRTKALRYRLLKSIYELLGHEVELPVRAVLKRELLPVKNTFTPEGGKVIIRYALSINEPIDLGRELFYPEYVRGFITVVFVYGLRRYEFFKMRPEDFVKADRTLLIRSAKGSVKRYHYVYDEILPIIEALMENLRHPSEMPYLNMLFRHLVKSAQVKSTRNKNVHAVRKTLASLLLQAGANPVFVNDFLRWKGRGTMMEYYANLDPVHVDLEIAKYHPFLSEFKAFPMTKNSSPTAPMN